MASRSVLIARNDHLGDAVLTTPLARALAKGGYQVDFLLPDAWMPILDGNPFVRSCQGLGQIAPDFPRSWRGLARWIRGRSYDVLVLPCAKPPTLLWASLFSGVPRRIAFSARYLGRVTLHTCLSGSLVSRRPYSDILLDATRHLNVKPDGPAPDIVLSDAERTWAEAEVLKRWGGGRVVGIHFSDGGNACNLSPAAYEDLCHLLLKRTDWNLALTGGKQDRTALENWNPAILRSPRVWNSAGTLGLRQLAALIGRMDLYVVGSTGPLHMAGALRTRTLSPFCTFSIQSADVWGPKTGQAAVLEPPARACADFSCARRNFCDFSGKISPEQLAAKAIEIVQGAAP